ncbi:hypothetical protein PUR57_35430 [Streptomyces sp. JV176]|uniref:hypothetical protein n=1 Tax=Streptomyces sp. JV176 TaxID=858630 RepID=UPI002E76F16B|nr:hypothetical protein [Streptomyces sp. JV176]MEE1803904.1 hypothetical protein [Streptomyces sp. JV176]
MTDIPRLWESLELMRRRIALRKLRKLLERQRAAYLVDLAENLLQQEAVRDKLNRAELERLDDPEHFAQIFGSPPPKGPDDG